jgi:uncharacterized protein (TIGR00369 family)
VDRDALFWQIMEGKAPAPRCADTLGITFSNVRPDEGTIEVGFVAKAEFLNHTGVVQGGFLAAMLDDTLGPALAATLGKGEFAPTANLNVSFFRPAKVGELQGKGRVVRRGRGVCFLAGELFQDGELIASATATAIIRRIEAGPTS